MRRRLLAYLVILFIPAAVLADSPPDIKTPDTHSVPAKGNINLYRVQTPELGFGEGKDKVDAEVFITLDTNPQMVYSLRVAPDSPPINRVLADTLRDAYINNIPVTVYHQIAPGKQNVKINMVQLEPREKK